MDQTKNFVEWITQTATDNGLYDAFNPRSYNHINGSTMENMTPEHFIDLTRSREAGLKLFQTRQNSLEGILALERISQESYINFANSHETAKNIQAQHQTFESNQLPTVVANPVQSNNKVKTGKGPGRPRKEPRNDRAPNNNPYGKIWEFIDKLLSNKETCPSLIKWDDYKAGTFKFVQPKKIAQLWGLRKNNTKMDYNKFTRALRYHYKKGFLNSVEEKRLVYKFGPRAIELRNKSSQNASQRPAPLTVQPQPCELIYSS